MNREMGRGECEVNQDKLVTPAGRYYCKEAVYHNGIVATSNKKKLKTLERQKCTIASIAIVAPLISPLLHHDNYDDDDETNELIAVDICETHITSPLTRISLSELYALDKFTGNRAEKRVRSKKKWKPEMSKKSTKKCFQHQNIDCSNVQCLNIHQHETNERRRRPRRIKISFKEIDHNKGLTYEELHRSSKKRECARAITSKRKECYTLNDTNVDNGLSTDLISILISVQHRDITPEDYELLLQLDETVKPKTVQKSTLCGYKTEEVTVMPHSEMCAICIEPYCVSDIRRYLPQCGHHFHRDCIDVWLRFSSTSCPLDGISVIV